MIKNTRLHMLRSLTEPCAGIFFFNRSRAHFEIPLSRVYFAVLPSQRPPGGGSEGVVVLLGGARGGGGGCLRF